MSNIIIGCVLTILTILALAYAIHRQSELSSGDNRPLSALTPGNPMIATYQSIRNEVGEIKKLMSRCPDLNVSAIETVLDAAYASALNSDQMFKIIIQADVRRDIIEKLSGLNDYYYDDYNEKDYKNAAYGNLRNSDWRHKWRMHVPYLEDSVKEFGSCVSELLAIQQGLSKYRVEVASTVHTYERFLSTSSTQEIADWRSAMDEMKDESRVLIEAISGVDG